MGEEPDITIFENLLTFNNTRINLEIIWLIPCFYDLNPARALKIIQRIAKIVAENELKSLASHILDKHAHKTFDYEKWDERIYAEIIWAYIRVPDLDWHMVSALASFGKRFPLKLIDFFEERIKEKRKRNAKKTRLLTDRYDPVPYEVNELSKMFLKHPKYPEVIDKILIWFKKQDWVYQWEGQQLLSGISPGPDVILQHKLRDYILTGKKEDILLAVKALSHYHGILLELYKEAIKYSKGDEEVCSTIISTFSSTGVVSGERGFIYAYGSKIKQLEKWKTDEDPDVRKFAVREIDSYKQRIEYEERNVALEEIARRKGL